MEKEIVPLREKLKYMIGIRFDRVKHSRNGLTVARGYYVIFAFYWFCLALFRNWPLPLTDRHSTGIVLSWKPNPTAGHGDLMWLRDKEWLRLDYPEELSNAEKIPSAKRRK